MKECGYEAIKVRNCVPNMRSIERGGSGRTMVKNEGDGRWPSLIWFGVPRGRQPLTFSCIISFSRFSSKN